MLYIRISLGQRTPSRLTRTTAPLSNSLPGAASHSARALHGRCVVSNPNPRPGLWIPQASVCRPLHPHSNQPQPLPHCTEGSMVERVWRACTSVAVASSAHVVSTPAPISFCSIATWQSTIRLCRLINHHHAHSPSPLCNLVLADAAEVHHPCSDSVSTRKQDQQDLRRIEIVWALACARIVGAGPHRRLFEKQRFSISSVLTAPVGEL